MEKEQRPIPKKIRLIAFLLPIFALGSISICSAQNTDSVRSIKKNKPYSLRINRGDYWMGGALGISGAVAPMGQYIGTAATLSIKGGYHIIDKLSVGLTITGALSIADKKENGVYTRGASLLAGPLVQYMLPISNTFFLSPIAAVTFGPINIKSMTSAAGAPEEYIRIKGNAMCQVIGIGPFFEVIPEKASFGAHFLFSFLQQTTNVYTDNGDHIPGTKITDKKNGPGLVMEFKLHF